MQVNPRVPTFSENTAIRLTSGDAGLLLRQTAGVENEGNIAGGLWEEEHPHIVIFVLKTNLEFNNF